MDVLCVGHASWDITACVAEYPAENSKCEISTLLECGGGPAANAACLLASWGVSCALAATIGGDAATAAQGSAKVAGTLRVPSASSSTATSAASASSAAQGGRHTECACYFTGREGLRDAYADRVLDELSRAGVDVSLVHRSPADPTPVSIILVNRQNASRTIVNRKAPVAADPCRIVRRPDWAEGPKVLLFDGHEIGASLDAMALFPDARTILDAGSARPGAVELARRVDYLVASERFARQLGGVPDLASRPRQAAAMQALAEHNGRPVVITCGERGLLYGTGDDFRHLPAFAVNSIDTTAAGDIFHGAFAYGLLKELPWEDVLRLAAAAAALSTTARGGRTSIPSLAQVEEFLAHAR
jgi:sugar/nucleoside kinase (ribokinase family)